MPPLKALGDLGQPLGNVFRDGGADLGRIKTVRLGPDRAQAILHIRVEEIVHRQAVGLPVGEVRVVAALPGEVRENLDHIANVDNQQERGVVVFGW